MVNGPMVVEAFLRGGVVNVIIIDAIIMANTGMSLFGMYKKHPEVLINIFMVQGMVCAVINVIFQMFPS